MAIREGPDGPADEAGARDGASAPSLASVQATLLARRERIIDAWLPAVSSIGSVAYSRADLRAQLAVCVDRIIALFAADDAQAQMSARQIGGDLANLFYLRSEGLERSHTVLSNELIAAVPGEWRALRSETVRLITSMICGYLDRTRQAVLDEQESTRDALLQTLRRTERDLEESRARFQSLFFKSAIGIWIATMDGETLDANPALLTMLDRSVAELNDLDLRELIYPDDRAKFVPLWAQLSSGQIESFQAEARYLHKLGHPVWGYLTVSLIRGADGQTQYLVAMLQDISEQRRNAEALSRADDHLRRLVQNSADFIGVIDPWGEITYLSPAVARVLGYEPAELLHQEMRSLFDPVDYDAIDAFWQKLHDAPEQAQSGSVRIRHKSGTWRWIGVTCANRFDDPAIQGIVVNARDVTAQIELEDRLARMAYTDHLTGLASRTRFTNRLQRALDSGQPIAVLFADLDRFKLINDSLGHEAGDEALVALAERFKGCVDPDDVVARLGGDEFAVLLHGADDASAWSTAQCLLHAMQAPVTLQQRYRTVLNTSIGIAVSGPDLDNQNALLRAADLALYRAKADGRAIAAVFEPEMHGAAVERLKLEADLQLALARSQIFLVYQPKVDLHTGQVVALEALVRWERPGHGLVPPADFMLIAEETGLIVPIGQWVLAEACTQMRHWRDVGANLSAVTLCLNLSSRELRQDGLNDRVAGCLRANDLAPDQLCLEVSERPLMEDVLAATPVLAALRDLGVEIAIDDFGAGRTSLASLPKLMASTLKIDRALISPLGQNQADLAIIKIIAALAHTLHMRVCAEGIETRAQLDHVREANCDYGQGYYFSAPLPAEAVPAYLASV